MKNRRNILRVILPVAACFGLLPGLQAVSPTPDGCYPNFTTASGCNALNLLTSGAGNTGLGWYALFSDSTGNFNTAVGGGALALSNGDSNTAVGAAALLLNSTGSNNTAVGTGALVNNIVDDNTATGFSALFANTTGGTLETSVLGVALGPNTAIGSHALENNVDASANTAVGYNALHSQVTGDVLAADPHFGANTAVGFEALANVTGSANGDNAANDAEGYQALFNLTDGEGNVAVGFQAGISLTDGDENIAVGGQAGLGLTSGSDNIFIGLLQGPATATENHHTYIGNINSTAVSGGGTDTVTIDLTTGLLGHLTSSRRYKEDIKPMDKTSEALYRLHPVTYRYKKEIDRSQSPAFGLIAEEVASVNPNLVARNSQGQPESIHYEMVNAMLLNEFLKEHKKVEQQEETIAQLKKELQATTAHQQRQIESLTTGLQKVSAEIELSKTKAQTIVNNQ